MEQIGIFLKNLGIGGGALLAVAGLTALWSWFIGTHGYDNIGLAVPFVLAVYSGLPAILAIISFTKKQDSPWITVSIVLMASAQIALLSKLLELGYEDGIFLITGVPGLIATGLSSALIWVAQEEDNPLGMIFCFVLTFIYGAIAFM